MVAVEQIGSADCSLELDVARAREGDRKALESVIGAVQGKVYSMAMHFLWHPQDAEDATQDILIRVITNLGNYRGEGKFHTWVYRIACNRLLTLRKQRMEKQMLSFEEFGEDLLRGVSDISHTVEYNVDELLLLEEVKVGCTLAMLLCLDRNHRIAYILGEIIEVDHQEAGMALEISPATFRKRLSRARSTITTFMASKCGLYNANNACQCRKRILPAIKLGRIDPEKLMFASSLECARRFPDVLKKIRQLEDARRAAALYRSHPKSEPAKSFISWIRCAIDDRSDACAGSVVSGQT